MVTVSIQLIADTQSIPLRTGQGLYIASNLHGGWNIDEAAMLTVDPLEKGEGVIPTHYVWRHVLTLPKFIGTFEYKYIVRALQYEESSTNPHNSLCRWEDGPIRSVDLKSVKEDILLKNDLSVTFPSLDMYPVTVPPTRVRSIVPPGVIVGGHTTVHHYGGGGGDVLSTSASSSRSVSPGETAQHGVQLSMTSLNLSMDFLEGDDDLPPPMSSPVGLSFLRPAASPHDGSASTSSVAYGGDGTTSQEQSNKVTQFEKLGYGTSPGMLSWGTTDTAKVGGNGGQVLDPEDDTDYQQKLLETAAENLLNA
jgi:hypothetical protein